MVGYLVERKKSRLSCNFERHCLVQTWFPEMGFMVIFEIRFILRDHANDILGTGQY